MDATGFRITYLPEGDKAHMMFFLNVPQTAIKFSWAYPNSNNRDEAYEFYKADKSLAAQFIVRKGRIVDEKVLFED